MNRRSPFGWMELVLGILMLGAGILLLVRPAAILSGFVFIYASGIIVVGIADLVFYVRLERQTGFGPVISLVAGILNILTGILLFMNFRFGVLVLAVLLPVGLIAHSVARLVNLGFVRRYGGGALYWLSLIAGALGIVLGGLLLVSPQASFRAMSCVVGGYLVLLGCVRIATAASRLGG